MVLFDSRIPAGKNKLSRGRHFTVKPVFLITTRCYVLNESRFSRRHSLRRVLTVVGAHLDAHTPRLTSILLPIIGLDPLPTSRPRFHELMSRN